MENRTTIRSRSARFKPLAAALLSAAVGMALGACESPLRSNDKMGETDRYTESLIARAVFEGKYSGGLPSTYAGEVREYARVDSPGPAQPVAVVPAFSANETKDNEFVDHNPPRPHTADLVTPALVGPMMKVVAAGPVSVTTSAPDNLPRVDSPGPETPATFPSTKPAVPEISSIAAAESVGRASAQINMPEPVVPLTLQDAIARTVQHALSIKVSAYNPGIRDALITVQEAAFDPVFFGASQWSKIDEPFLTPKQPGFTNGNQWNNQIGIKRELPTGAEVSATANLNYRDVDTSLFSKAAVAQLGGLRTNYVTNFGLQISQPLLRNFGTDVNLSNIYIAQRDYRESLSDFKRDVMKAVSDVEDAYHTLSLARTNVEIQERLVVASQQTFDVIWDRRTIDATKASMYQALSALEQREAGLMDAQRAYRDASDKLKGLMNDPDLDPRSNILINPVDRPVGEPFNYDVNDCIDTALRQRPEMQHARFEVEKSDIIVTVQRNALLPKLDMTAGMQTNGLAGDPGNSIGQNFNPANNIDFNFGLKFEIPLGNRDAEAQLQRRLLERKQAVTNLVQVAQTVVQDVRLQARAVLSSYTQLQKLDRVRIDSANELQGILEIEEIRGRTPEFLQLKLDSQQRLADAEQAVVQALVNYNLSIMRLELAKGTLLEFNHISMDRPPAKFNQGLDDLRFMGETYTHGMQLTK